MSMLAMPGMYPSYGGGGISPRSVMNDRRLDEVRHRLFKFLAVVWRPKEDTRESHCEVIHVRSGTPIGSLSVPENDRPEHVADWVMEQCKGFMQGVGEPHAQCFNILFDEARHSFWIYPDGGDEGAGNADAAFQEQRLRHHETMHLQYTDATDKVLGHLGKVIDKLSDDVTAKSEVIARMSAEQTAQLSLYKELIEKKHAYDISTMKETKSEERKAMLVERFVKVLDQAGEIGGNLIMQKVAQKVSEGADFDKLANLLTEVEDQEKLKELIRKGATHFRALKAGSPPAPAAAAPAPAPTPAAAAPEAPKPEVQNGVASHEVPSDTGVPATEPAASGDVPAPATTIPDGGLFDPE